MALTKMKRVGDFQLTRLIGVSTYGEVYLGIHLETMKEVAVKALEKSHNSPSVLNSIKHEVKIMRSIRHQHIVRFIDAMETPNRVYIVMEYCPDGDLSCYICSRGKVNEFLARNWLHQVLLGLEGLERHRVIHRDVKPANILLSQGNAVAKLADFGFARIIARVGEPMSYLGTPLYMSPELLNSQVYDSRSDVWSFGVTAYEILIGETPFKATNMLELREAQRERISFPPEISSVAARFLYAALTYDVERRPTITELLQHEFFNGLEAPPSIAPVEMRQAPQRVPDDVLQQATLELNFLRVELEETLHESQFYSKRNKLAGLALLYGVIEKFKKLFTDLERLKSHFELNVVQANHSFTDLYELVQGIILLEASNFAEKAQKLRIDPEPSDAVKEHMGNALLLQVRKEVKKVKKKTQRARSVFRVVAVVMMLLPHSEEVVSLHRDLAESSGRIR